MVPIKCTNQGRSNGADRLGKPFELLEGTVPSHKSDFLVVVFLREEKGRRK